MIRKPCPAFGCRALIGLHEEACAGHLDQMRKDRWEAADRARVSVSWRSWYRTPQWQRLRVATLKRFGNFCQYPGCGVILTTGRDKPNSAVIDHIAPHRGDRALFFDPENLWPLCRTCHNSLKQSDERRNRVLI